MNRGTDTSGGRRRPSRLPYVVATVAMGLLVVSAWIGRGRFQPVIAGSPAPSFTAFDMEGRPTDLSAYEGKVVLVNVWATWCAPCRAEMPSLEAMYQDIRAQPGGEDFEIVAVSVDASLDAPDLLGRGVKRSDLVEFAEELGVTFPILHDPDGGIQMSYQTIGVPESFIVGRDGVIYRKIAGATVWESPQYRELILRLLKG